VALADHLTGAVGAQSPPLISVVRGERNLTSECDVLESEVTVAVLRLVRFRSAQPKRVHAGVFVFMREF
jgi:hypothetical protein